VYAMNGCGDASLASVMTGGTLDYILGDVTNGYVHGLGDNLVHDEDFSELGAHYGITLAPVGDPYDYLDVGPTTTHYVDGRPTTDKKVDFEDLVIFAIDYSMVSGPAGPAAMARAHGSSLTPATSDVLVIQTPDQATLGQTVTVPISFQGTGQVQAVSIGLSWDAAVVTPVSQAAGDLLLDLHGLALSAKPGTLDVAALGKQGLVGTGALATVNFNVIANGDPKIRIETVDARDARNRALAVNATRELLAPALPKVTTLQWAAPNPFRQTVALAVSLAEPGPMELSIYSVDGRRVRTLATGLHEAGNFRFVWDGRDEAGNGMHAGVFYARFIAGHVKATRTMVYLR
jgi:hypothetical protein